MSVAYRHRRFSYAQKKTYKVTVVLKKDLIVLVVLVVVVVD